MFAAENEFDGEGLLGSAAMVRGKVSDLPARLINTVVAGLSPRVVGKKVQAVSQRLTAHRGGGAKRIPAFTSRAKLCYCLLSSAFCLLFSAYSARSNGGKTAAKSSAKRAE